VTGVREDSRRRFRWLCAATLFEFLALGVFLVSLPLFLSDELGASSATIGLTVGAFSVSAVVLRPVVGRQADRRGRLRFLMAAPVILLLSSGGLALADSVIAVVGLRMFQGVAGACFYTAGATIATDLAPVERRAEYLGRFSLFIYSGFAVGPLLADRLVHAYGFGAAWAAAATFAIAAFVAARRVGETNAVGGFTGAPVSPEKPPVEVVRAKIRMFHPASIGPGLVLTMAATGYNSITVFSPLYARSIDAPAGLFYLVFALTIIGVRALAAGVADRRGRVAVAAPGMAASAVGLALLASTPPAPLALAGVAVFASGFAVVFPALMALTDDGAPLGERGEALGSTVAFFDIGAWLGGYTVGAVADAAGFGAGFAVPATLCVLGTALVLRLGGRQTAAVSSSTGCT